MKIYVVLEDRGLIRMRPMFQGVWYDKKKAQEFIEEYCPRNGYIMVYDLDNPRKGTKDLLGLLIPKQLMEP